MSETETLRPPPRDPLTDNAEVSLTRSGLWRWRHSDSFSRLVQKGILSRSQVASRLVATLAQDVVIRPVRSIAIPSKRHGMGIGGPRTTSPDCDEQEEEDAVPILEVAEAQLPRHNPPHTQSWRRQSQRQTKTKTTSTLAYKVNRGWQFMLGKGGGCHFHTVKKKILTRRSTTPDLKIITVTSIVIWIITEYNKYKRLDLEK